MFEDYPDILTIRDVQKLLRIGRSKTYELVRTNQIRSVKIGNAIRIPKKSLLVYISELEYNGSEVDKRRYVEGGNNESNRQLTKQEWDLLYDGQSA